MPSCINDDDITNREAQQQRFTVGHIPFQEAYEIFDSCFPTMGLSHSEKQEFQKILLHTKFGLKVVIFTGIKDKKYILLSPEDGDIEPFLLSLTQDISLLESDTNSSRENAVFVRGILNSLQTEWDQKYACALLALNHSRTQLEDLTVDPVTVTKNSNQVAKVLDEIDNARIASNDIVRLRLKAKKEKWRKQLSPKQLLFERRKERWSDSKLTQLEIEISDLTQWLHEMESFDINTNKYHKRKFDQLVSRTQKQLIEENRLTKRTKSSGRPAIIDEEIEDFVVKCISEKCVSHGRRQDTAMYSSVKVKDLLGLANAKLKPRGQRIRSATSIWNLSKPRNRRSVQAKLYRGSGMFCTKVPYKAGDTFDENTHHRRAFKKNIRDFFFSERAKANKKYCLMRSIDDKAYLRPGTSEGFNSVRNKRILTPAASEKMRKLPKYDWPIKKVYQTPLTHRVLMLEGFDVEGNEKLGSTGDSHYVFVRLKSFVDFSGTTSETVFLRHTNPLDFEVDERCSRSKVFRQILAITHDYVFQFIDMTETNDIKKVSYGDQNCCHAKYETSRVAYPLNGIEQIIELSLSVDLKVVERERIHNLKLDELHSALLNFQQPLQMFTEEVILTEYNAITAKLSYILNQINDLGPVDVKPRWCDLSDAGPGIAVSKFDVHFRDAELARMWGSVYRKILHLSRNDSHSNEAERTNSAIADSVVDGQTTEWEFHKLFDGISDDKIEAMILQEFERHQDERMKLNAYMVRDEVVKRIDGAPCSKEEIVAYPSPDDPFFFYKAEIYKQHTASNPSVDPKVPGIFYFHKIRSYIQKHYQMLGSCICIS